MELETSKTIPLAAAQQAKNWCFTLQINEQCSRLDGLCQIETLSKSATYVLAGQEVAATGQEHYQGYVQFAERKRFSQVKLLLPTAHWEVAKGDDEQNYKYCTKEGKYTEFGERRCTRGGKKGGEKEQRRWAETREFAVSGRVDLVDDQIFVQHYSALKCIAKDHIRMPAKLDKPCGIWYYGEPGVGKSYRARQENPDAYLKTANKWWDSYDARSNPPAILDDIEPCHSVLGHHIKIWADEYPFLAETKFGFIGIRPRLFVVTSNFTIDEIFTDPKIADAIRRRFTCTRMLGNPFRSLTSRLNQATSTTGHVPAGFNPPPPSPSRTPTAIRSLSPTSLRALWHEEVSNALRDENTTPVSSSEKNSSSLPSPST